MIQPPSEGGVALRNGMIVLQCVVGQWAGLLAKIKNLSILLRTGHRKNISIIGLPFRRDVFSPFIISMSQSPSDVQCNVPPLARKYRIYKCDNYQSWQRAPARGDFTRMTDQQWSLLESTLLRINDTLDRHEERIRVVELGRAKVVGFTAAIGGLFGGGLTAILMRLFVPVA